MKKIISILFVLVTLISCSEKKEKKTKDANIENIELKQLHFDLKTNENLKDWFDYYKSEDSTFSLSDFKFERTDTLDFIKGNVLGLFDRNFDKIYTDFLVFSEDKNKYIDFDSYYWTLDDEKKPLFEIDQEINLVDIRKRTVTRIGLRSSTSWVENAFWENDSTIIFLENNTENCPRITKVGLKNSQSETFKYKDCMSLKPKYKESRLQKKGLKN
jgi:hypothetical protein